VQVHRSSQEEAIEKKLDVFRNDPVGRNTSYAHDELISLHSSLFTQFGVVLLQMHMCALQERVKALQEVCP
jgi:hypothetical protein